MTTTADKMQLFDDGTTLGDMFRALGYVKAETRPRGRPTRKLDEAQTLESAKKQYEAARRANKKYYAAHRTQILEKARQAREADTPKN
jgi:hypothetical protein